MTVRETAAFYAALLLPGSWGAPARRERVAQVLAAMGLSHTEDTLVRKSAQRPALPQKGDPIHPYIVRAVVGVCPTCSPPSHYTLLRTHAQVGGALPGGIQLRGLSGGERKRLAVAAGVIATPAVIFLDEPTSGLDAFAALRWGCFSLLSG